MSHGAPRFCACIARIEQVPILISQIHVHLAVFALVETSPVNINTHTHTYTYTHAHSRTHWQLFNEQIWWPHLVCGSPLGRGAQRNRSTRVVRLQPVPRPSDRRVCQGVQHQSHPETECSSWQELALSVGRWACPLQGCLSERASAVGQHNVYLLGWWGLHLSRMVGSSGGRAPNDFGVIVALFLHVNQSLAVQVASYKYEKTSCFFLVMNH